MRMDAAFPSKHLSAADLQGQLVTVTISHVDMDEVGQDKELRPVLHFMGKQKGLVLNKTNNNTLCGAFGVESEEWAGKQIQLIDVMVDFQGKQVPAIRIRIPSTPRQQAQTPTQQNGNGNRAPATDNFSDSIPF